MEKIEKLYTALEVANMTRQSRETIYRHIKSGKLKTSKIGDTYKITESELNKYLGK